MILQFPPATHNIPCDRALSTYGGASAKEKVKTSNDSIVVAQHGDEIAVCALIDLIRSGFGHRMPAMDDTRS